MTHAHTARQTRDNRTITVDFRSEATYFQLLVMARRSSNVSSPSSWPRLSAETQSHLSRAGA